MTNLGAKVAKRTIKMWTISLYKSFFKNILLYINGRTSKTRSVHPYVFTRTVYFDWICIFFNKLVFIEKYDRKYQWLYPNFNFCNYCVCHRWVKAYKSRVLISLNHSCYALVDDDTKTLVLRLLVHTPMISGDQFNIPLNWNSDITACTSDI